MEGTRVGVHAQLGISFFEVYVGDRLQDPERVSLLQRFTTFHGFQQQGHGLIIVTFTAV